MRSTEIEVLGEIALLFEQRTVYSGHQSSSFQVNLPPSGRTTVSLYVSSISRPALLDVLGSLHRTDVETWLAALPRQVVEPLERPEVVDEMLADVPIPASVDIEALKEEATAGTRYQLGARVTGVVACGWLDQWAAAIDSGDSAASNEATDAMQTSRDWAILREMKEQGGWSQTVWQYAGEMRRGEREALLGTSGTDEYPDGSVYERSPSYATGLGCDSERLTLVRESNGLTRPSGGRAVPVDVPSKP